MEAKGQRGTARMEPCLLGALCSALQKPASPGCQCAGCQWCQDHFHSQLPRWHHQHFIIPSCLEALVVICPSPSYKTYAAGNCADCSGKVAAVASPPRLDHRMVQILPQTFLLPSSTLKVKFRGRWTARRGVSASLHPSSNGANIEMKL